MNLGIKMKAAKMIITGHVMAKILIPATIMAKTANRITVIGITKTTGTMTVINMVNDGKIPQGQGTGKMTTITGPCRTKATGTRMTEILPATEVIKTGTVAAAMTINATTAHLTANTTRVTTQECKIVIG